MPDHSIRWSLLVIAAGDDVGFEMIEESIDRVASRGKQRLAFRQDVAGRRSIRAEGRNRSAAIAWDPETADPGLRPEAGRQSADCSGWRCLADTRPGRRHGARRPVDAGADRAAAYPDPLGRGGIGIALARGPLVQTDRSAAVRWPTGHGQARQTGQDSCQDQRKRNDDDSRGRFMRPWQSRSSWPAKRHSHSRMFMLAGSKPHLT